MATDGSIIFDTKIDADGFNKGTKNMSSKAIDLKNKIAQTTREIKSLEDSLREMANTPIKTNISAGIEKDITKAKEQLKSLYNKADEIGNSKQKDLTDLGLGTEHLDSILSNDKEWNKVQQQITESENKLKEYEAKLKSVRSAENSTTGKDTAEYKEKQEKLTRLNEQLNTYKARLVETESKEKTTSKQTNINTDILKKFTTAIKKLGKKMKTVFSNTVVSGIKKIGSHLKNLFSHTKKTSSQMGGFAKALNRIKQAIGGMLLYKVIQGGVEALKDSLGEMAKECPAVNKQLSALLTSFTYIKNSIATAFLPILTVVTPILTGLMDTLSKATNKMAEFFSALTGQSSYVKAVKVQQNYAKSLDTTTKSTKANTKATKENQKNLASYDQLNVMEQSSSSNNAKDSNASNGKQFKTVATPFSNFANQLKKAISKGDYGAVAKILSKKLNSVLSSIDWKSIRQKAKNIASNIADFINGAIEEIDWFLLGTTLGNGLMTAIDFLYTLIKKIKWKKLGKSIASFLNGAIKSINFIEIAKLLGESINGIFEFALGFAKEFDWIALGESIRNALTELFNTLDVQLVIDAVSSMINGVFTTALTIVGDPDFTELGSKTAQALKDMLNKINWKNISKLFFTLLKGVFDFANGFQLEINWEKVGESLASTFNSFFGDKGEGHKFITSISNAFWGFLGGAITALKSFTDNINWEEFGNNLLKTVRTAVKKGGDLVAKLLSVAGTIVNELLKSLNKVFTDRKTSKSITASIKKSFDNVDWAEIVVNAFTLLVNACSTLVDGIGDLLDDLTQEMADGFSHNKNNSKIEKAVVELVKAIANLFISILNLAFKLIVNVIPNLVLSLFRLIIEMVTWLGSIFLGDEWYQTAEDSLKKEFPVMDFDWEIPKLATGTVVPASHGEFLAMLGDNKRETEVVSPLSTMKQAFLEAMAEGNFGGNDKDINLTINLDGEVIFKGMVNKDSDYRKRFGKSAFA